MKFRDSFVTNSSSTSYILVENKGLQPDLTVQDFAREFFPHVYKKVLKYNETNKLYLEKVGHSGSRRERLTNEQQASLFLFFLSSVHTELPTKNFKLLSLHLYDLFYYNIGPRIHKISFFSMGADKIFKKEIYTKIKTENFITSYEIKNW